MTDTTPCGFSVNPAIRAIVVRNSERMNRRFGHSTRMAVVIISVALFGCAEKMDSVPEFVAQAQMHERNGLHAEAIQAYSQALEINASDPTLWYDRGVAHAEIRQFQQAIEDYTRAIELNSGYAQAFNNRGAVYAQLKQFDQSIEDCSRAIALTPDDALAYRNRGLAYHDRTAYDDAIKDYNTAIRINGQDAISYFYRGNVFLEWKKYERAIEDFNQALDLDGTLEDAKLNRTVAASHLGDGGAPPTGGARPLTFGPNVTARADQPGELTSAMSNSADTADGHGVVTLRVPPALDDAAAGAKSTTALALPMPSAAEPGVADAVDTAESAPTDEQSNTAAAEATREAAVDHDVRLLRYLTNYGFDVKSVDDPVWDLAGTRNGNPVRVMIRRPIGNDRVVEFSTAELQAITLSDIPTTLVVCATDPSPSTDALPPIGSATADDPSAIRHFDGWQPAPLQLVPVRFAYQLQDSLAAGEEASDNAIVDAPAAAEGQ